MVLLSIQFPIHKSENKKPCNAINCLKEVLIVLSVPLKFKRMVHTLHIYSPNRYHNLLVLCSSSNPHFHHFIIKFYVVNQMKLRISNDLQGGQVVNSHYLYPNSTHLNPSEHYHDTKIVKLYWAWKKEYEKWWKKEHIRYFFLSTRRLFIRIWC